MEGQHVYFDSLQEIGMEYNEARALELCKTMKETALAACKTEDEKADIQEITVAKLEDMGLLCLVGRDYAPTHAFNLMTENKIKYAKIKCALFKGVERDEFIDRKEFVFDDRVEIVSPGMLYGGLDMKAALEGKSKCRNAAISEAFYYMGIVEAWGTGLGRIQKSCREHNLQEPVIEEFGDGFRVVFFRRGRINSKDNSEMRGKDEATYLSSAERTASDIESSTEKTANNIESSIETEKRSMETIENRLIKLLLKQPEITQQQAANQLGYSKAWIRKNMEKLQRDGIIYREGSTKKGRWIVLQ